MGKKLGIKGHSTRGKEVIELLEMMGGINDEGYIGTNTWKDEYYFLDNGCIHAYDWCDGIKFTLEEFFEKYPFKVGDVVFDIVDGDPGIITAMKWDEDVSDMKYRVAFDNGDMGWFINSTIDFYLNKNNKKINRNMETNQNKVNGLKRGDEYPIMEGVECNKCIKYYFPEGYEFVDTDDTGIYLKPIKSKYPMTYAECCEVIANSKPSAMNNLYIDVTKRLQTLQTLIICRNAYWKIAGEEMGLGKPWKPDWKNGEQKKYCIYYSGGDIQKGTWCQQNSILAFSTDEMRDAFLENFKDLIEQCKELL